MTTSVIVGFGINVTGVRIAVFVVVVPPVVPVARMTNVFIAMAVTMGLVRMVFPIVGMAMNMRMSLAVVGVGMAMGVAM